MLRVKKKKQFCFLVYSVYFFRNFLKDQSFIFLFGESQFQRKNTQKKVCYCETKKKKKKTLFIKKENAPFHNKNRPPQQNLRFC